MLAYEIKSIRLFVAPLSIILRFDAKWNVNEIDITYYVLPGYRDGVGRKAAENGRGRDEKQCRILSQHQTKSCEFNNKHDMKNLRFYWL